jgi:hypothetical protein
MESPLLGHYRLPMCTDPGGACVTLNDASSLQRYLWQIERRRASLVFCSSYYDLAVCFPSDHSSKTLVQDSHES